jgi:hypothetical protein
LMIHCRNENQNRGLIRCWNENQNTLRCRRRCRRTGARPPRR